MVPIRRLLLLPHAAVFSQPLHVYFLILLLIIFPLFFFFHYVLSLSYCAVLKNSEGNLEDSQ